METEFQIYNNENQQWFLDILLLMLSVIQKNYKQTIRAFFFFLRRISCADEVLSYISSRAEA